MNAKLQAALEKLQQERLEDIEKQTKLPNIRVQLSEQEMLAMLEQEGYPSLLIETGFCHICKAKLPDGRYLLCPVCTSSKKKMYMREWHRRNWHKAYPDEDYNSTLFSDDAEKSETGGEGNPLADTAFPAGSIQDANQQVQLDIYVEREDDQDDQAIRHESVITTTEWTPPSLVTRLNHFIEFAAKVAEEGEVSFEFELTVDDITVMIKKRKHG